mmetsp:Transcript_6041/g.13418  ORF Transcript_6041/g.13418 Transcript_6041/m.13418 type:complete len:243 (+) Transcript_6041:199-927(+)
MPRWQPWLLGWRAQGQCMLNRCAGRWVHLLRILEPIPSCAQASLFGLVLFGGSGDLLDEVGQCVWYELLAVVLRLATHLLDGDEALEARVHSQAEDVHVELPYNVTHADVDDHWRNGIGLRVHCLQEEVANHSCGRCDEEVANQVREPSQHRDCTKAKEVSPNQRECILRRSAEVRAKECHLNVGVLVQKFQALFEAPDATLRNSHDDHHDIILLSLALLFQVLHAVPDKLHQCNDEGTEAQ